MGTAATKIKVTDPIWGTLEVRGTPVGIKRLQNYADRLAEYWKIKDAELADLAGLSKSTVWRFRNRITFRPEFGTVVEILVALDVDVQCKAAR